MGNPSNLTPFRHFGRLNYGSIDMEYSSAAAEGRRCDIADKSLNPTPAAAPLLGLV
jgi:hypothetical protein